MAGDDEIRAPVAEIQSAGRGSGREVSGTEPPREPWSDHREGLEEICVDDEVGAGDRFAFTSHADRDHG
ncbi:MAG: hypothetical protein ACRDZN_07885 [Acidimicrobiales bacterium]